MGLANNIIFLIFTVSFSSISLKINPATSTCLSNAGFLSELNAAMDQWKNILESSISFNRITTFNRPTVDFKKPISSSGSVYTRKFIRMKS